MEIATTPSVRRLVELLQSKHGRDILVMDLRQLTDNTVDDRWPDWK